MSTVARIDVPNTVAKVLDTVREPLSQVAIHRRQPVSEYTEDCLVGKVLKAAGTFPHLPTPPLREEAYIALFGQAEGVMPEIEDLLRLQRDCKAEFEQEIKRLDPGTLRAIGYLFYELSAPSKAPNSGQAGDVFNRILRLNGNGRSEVLSFSVACFDIARELEDRK